MRPLRKNVLLLVFLSYCLVVYGKYLGDSCYNNDTKASGLCIAVTDCLQAISNLMKGIQPQSCGFHGSVGLVCCPSDTSTQKPVTKFDDTVPSKSVNDIIPGEKSRQKCKDYEDLTYVYERQQTLIPGQKYLKKSICPWRADVNPIIIDGEPTFLGEFSHMVLLGYKSGDDTEWQCGGSLISEDFVLTAAHCLYSRNYGEPAVARIGDLNYVNPNDDTYVQQIPIESFYQHPQYNPPENYNDVALLKLARPAKLSAYVKPICLYTTSDMTKLDDVLVTGWGYTENGGEKSDHLLKATLNIFTTAQCNRTYGKEEGVLSRGIDENLQMCAGPLVGRKDTCQGDSGGPIQVRSSEYHCSYYLLAVTSFGKQCGVESIPAVYAKIYPHLKWIEGIVWP